MWQLRSVIRTKDGNVRGINCPIRRVRLLALAVLLIHRIVDECLIESAGSTKHLLLGSGSAQQTPAGGDTVGEIQGKRAQSALHEALLRSERCLIGDLDPCFRERAALVTWQRSVRGNVPLGGTGSLHNITPNDFLTGFGDIETVACSFHRRPTECSSNISGDVQLLPSGGGHLRGIEARANAGGSQVQGAVRPGGLCCLGCSKPQLARQPIA